MTVEQKAPPKRLSICGMALKPRTVTVAEAAGVLCPFFEVLLSAMMAAAAMTFSSVSVIANALRLHQARL
jgi:cation transport ATPase